MEEILETNERFMSDLEKCNGGAADGGVCFGEVCASHIVNFECYRYYALNYSFAHNLHLTLSKNNGAYRRSLDICYKDSRFLNRSMIELLSEPVQRITRYTMMIKAILNHTSPQHRDYMPLTRAYVKACGIASMADDDATKLATTCHVLQQSVKNAPCSLVNQNRSFIAHLDADEIHRVKGKPKRPVTLFLFADKLMIAERPNYSCRGIDLCDNGKSQDSFPMWNLKRDPMLKFRGWIDIEQVQIFEGAPDSPNSFVLFASDTQKQEYSRGRGPAPTTESHEDYFRRGLRLFSVASHDDNDQESLQRTAEFVNDFQKAQALAKRYGPNDQSYHRLWCESNVYSNIYDTTSYTHANYKHNIAVVYVEEETSVNLRPLFRGGSTAPWIVALVLQAAGRQGFRYHIWSKIPLHPDREILESIPLAPKQVNVDGKPNHIFGCVFWNNVFLCERHLRASDVYTHAHREELEVKPRSRSRSRSLTRSTSIPTLPGWLGGNSSQRSRSMSPSRGAVKPASSRSSPIHGGAAAGGKLSFSKKSTRSRSSSMTSSSSSGNTLARSLTKSTSSSTTATATLLDHYQPYQQQKQKQQMTIARPTSKMMQRKSLPPSLCPPSEPILPRPMVSSPQEDLDLANSRPSSRSSTRSSTSFNHAFANGPFSNSVSLASHSTRSSLSLEDLEMAKVI
ncbi:hypothetical protein BDB00DRAFT_485207 [Zychaea mexicana]|uniref:uncharacterized protein n=1 Tax=Zychaea mexicana TaxID=64656 RepID=UPI0022FDC582|nr:uncharacterized protein BDB00DRAFT_485207 [Zychaea mexicana]KAI9491504.1 hypothetical protein BDB00DRAFT_485207 [Zychaea mexicana]